MPLTPQVPPAPQLQPQLHVFCLLTRLQETPSHCHLIYNFHNSPLSIYLSQNNTKLYYTIYRRNKNISIIYSSLLPAFVCFNFHDNRWHGEDGAYHLLTWPKNNTQRALKKCYNCRKKVINNVRRQLSLKFMTKHTSDVATMRWGMQWERDTFLGPEILRLFTKSGILKATFLASF